MVADIGGARDAYRPGDLRGHVGENVAIQVGHHDDVESLGRIRHLGRADVHDPGLVGDVRILHGDFVEDLVGETVRHLHDVVVGEAGDLLTAVAARVFESVAHDLFAAGPGDQLQALHGAGAELILDAGVAIFFVLAHDHQVHARMQRVDERVIRNAWAYIGIEAERVAGGDVHALEAAAVRRGDGGLQEHRGAAQGLPSAGFNTP